jgi:transposase-like protein
MNTEISSPKTLMEAVKHYSDLDVCNAYMEKIKWRASDIRCPSCGGVEIGRIASRRMYQCKNKDCRKQFSAKVGTIFEDSPLGLDKWFVAVWSITNAKNGISSCELARALGVTQKTAWFMLHRVRLAMKTRSFKKMGGNGGIVEADETYIGGLKENMHKRKRFALKGTGGTGKSAVMGLLDRTTRKVHAKVIDGNINRSTLHPVIHKYVDKGTMLCTDAYGGYKGLSDDYIHAVIDHAIAYAESHVHTNGLENFWSILKRALKGTYIHASPEHLFRYLDEQILRFNERKGNDAQRFNHVMQFVPGRRITYRQLTGIPA